MNELTSPKDRFVSLAADASGTGAIRRLTFSRPKQKADAPKVTVTQYRSSSGEIMLRLDTFYDDGKNVRKNSPVSDAWKIFGTLFDAYKQGNLSLGSAEAQYMTSKKGASTVTGEVVVRAALASGICGELGSTDKEKRYFWRGDEPWLIALDISDKNGRVHDKRQSKFRQINRFTELLDDVYCELPADGRLTVCDLCCGKSYLSFAVYEYLTKIRGRDVLMLCVDRKRDVIDYCGGVAALIGAHGLRFVAGDVSNEAIYDDVFGEGEHVDLVVSLHACDIATDIVLRRAVKLGTRVILSTPCCHHELNGKIKAPELQFLTAHSMLARKLTDAVTDGLRVLMLEAEGYKTSTVELIDPDETPKNLMIRAVRKKAAKGREKLVSEYNAAIAFLGLSGSYYDIYSK